MANVLLVLYDCLVADAVRPGGMLFMSLYIGQVIEIDLNMFFYCIYLVVMMDLYGST
jgi:hypothetical protein